MHYAGLFDIIGLRIRVSSEERLETVDQRDMGLNKKHLFFHVLVVSLFLFFLSLSMVFPAFKKLEVKTDRADIHLKPDISSPVIETLEKGEVITLASSRTFRRQWNYIYFTSYSTATSKSGYIQSSLVSKLFKVTKVNSIASSNRKRKTTRKEISSLQKVFWGMESDRILEFEGDPQISERRNGWKVLEYHRKVQGMLCYIHYFFSGNRLVRTEYVFPGKYARKKWHIDDYRKIKTILTRDYGEPVEDSTFWYDPLYRNDPSSWGDAISLGHLEYQCHWLTPETRVSLSLSGLSEQVSLILNYASLSLQ